MQVVPRENILVLERKPIFIGRYSFKGVFYFNFKERKKQTNGKKHLQDA